MAKRITVLGIEITTDDNLDEQKVNASVASLGMIQTKLLKTALKLLDEHGLAICNKESVK